MSPKCCRFMSCLGCGFCGIDEDEEVKPLTNRASLDAKKYDHTVQQLNDVTVDKQPEKSEPIEHEEEKLERDDDDDMIKGKKLFNKSSKEGLKFLMDNLLIGREPRDVALFFKNATFLDKTVVGDYLGKNDPFPIQVLDEYVKLYTFRNMDFDQALRVFFGGGFRLPGEAQKIDRIVQRFASRYVENNSNSTVFSSPDAAYILAFSLIMLNTDLHNPNVKRKMTKSGFLRNNRGINNGGNLPDEYLIKMYDNFKKDELKMAEGLKFEDASFTFYNPEREGYLYKLGSKLSNWNKRYFLLTGNCLYYFEEETDESPRGIIPLENLDVREVSSLTDGKSRFCFEIYDPQLKQITKKSAKHSIKAVKFQSGEATRGQRLTYIFASETEEDRQDWMSRIKASIKPSPLYQLIQQKRIGVDPTRKPETPMESATSERSLLDYEISETSNKKSDRITITQFQEQLQLQLKQQEEFLQSQTPSPSINKEISFSEAIEKEKSARSDSTTEVEFKINTPN